MFRFDHNLTANMALFHGMHRSAYIGLCQGNFLRYMQFEFALVNELSNGFQIFIAVTFFRQVEIESGPLKIETQEPSQSSPEMVHRTL